MSKRTYTAMMREISGFGGGYEEACRAMVLAGVAWLEANPVADPQFSGYRGVYGVITEDNDDAKDLTAAIMNATVVGADGQPAAVSDGATGAMHQATVNHVLIVKTHGWDWYVNEMSKPDSSAPVH